MRYKPKRARSDVSAASAAVGVNYLDDWVKLPKPEQYERLRNFVSASITAFMENSRQVRRLPKPSRN